MLKDNGKVPALTDKEILQVRELLNKDIQIVIDDTIDRSKRVPKTYNIDVDTFLWVKARSFEKHCSTSDIVNSIIRLVMNKL